MTNKKEFKKPKVKPDIFSFKLGKYYKNNKTGHICKIVEIEVEGTQYLDPQGIKQVKFFRELYFKVIVGKDKDRIFRLCISNRVASDNGKLMHYTELDPKAAEILYG